MPQDPISDALKLIPYGFYAITSKTDDDENIMVANWITQVSFDPRMVAFGLQKSSYTHGIVEKGRVFAINIFRVHDQDAIMPFTKGRSKRPDKMEIATYSPAPETGSPILDGAAAYIEFKVAQILDIGGDHDIVIGEPVGAAILKEADVNDILSLPKLGWSYAG